MRAVFISYRRDDAEGQAGRLFKDLREHLGDDAVFMDVVDIEPGRDFRHAIDRQLASCGVLLAVIGKAWLDVKDESGRRRLDDPADFVRIETATALKRDIPVIPVLVQGAKMPKAEQLPQDLADLAYRNAAEITHARWDSDVQLLIKALRAHVGAGDGDPDLAAASSGARDAQARPAAPGAARPARDEAETALSLPASPRRPIGGVIVAVALAAIGVGGYIAYDRAERQAAEEAEAQRVAQEKAEPEKPALAALQAEAARLAEERAAAQAEAERAAQEKAALEVQQARAAAEKAAAEKAAAEAEAGRAIAEARAAKAAEAAAARADAERAAVQRAADTSRRTSRLPDSAAAVQSAAAKTTRYQGTIYTTNPCNNQALTVNVAVFLSIQTLPDKVVVVEQLSGNAGGLEVNLRGSAEFPRPAPSYDVPIRGQWRNRGALVFTSTGVDRVIADQSGTPSGDLIQRLDNRCQ